MKLFTFFIILIFSNSCSFDNKTGIWNSDDNLSKKEISLFSEFKTLTNSKNNFNRVIKPDKKIIFNIPKKVNTKEWSDIYYNKFNNFDNFSYNKKKNLILKSKKISKYELNEYFLYNEGNLILSDKKGNLIIFSKEQNNIVTKLNFYKKRYKKMDKNLNLVMDEGIIYISDNLGFIYAFDYKMEKILWAKNIKIPFRSNLKIMKNKLVAADQNNNIYFFEKKNGNILKLIPTEDTSIKNNFKNNLSLNINTVFFLNTYGSLYAIDNESNNVKWVLNLNQSLDINPSNLFNGNQIVSNENTIIITSQKSTFIINSLNGTIIKKLNIVSLTKPLIISNYLFIISSNNLLICIDIKDGDIVYSYKLNKKIAEYLEIKEKKALFKSIMFANDKILILLKNSYFLEVELNGNLKNIFKFPLKPNSDLIFILNSILYLDHKNKLIILG